MTQAPLFIGLYVLGLLLSFALGPRRYPSLCCALAFPIGLATWIVALIAILALGLPYNLWTAVIAGGLLFAVVLGLVMRGGPLQKAEAITIALWTAAFAITAVFWSSINASKLSFDSLLMVMLGEGVAHQQGFHLVIWDGLAERGTFLVVAQSVAGLIGLDYLYSLAPVLGLSFVALFATTLHHGLGATGAQVGRPWWMTAVVTTALFGTYMVGFHVVYIHANLPSAVYLFCFVSLFWLAEVERQVEYLPLCAIALLAFSLQRLEVPLISVLFLSLTLLQSKLPRRNLSAWFGVVCALLVAWYLILMAHIPPESRFLSVGRLAAVIAAVAGIYAVWLGRRWSVVDRLARHAPRVGVATCVIALIAAFATKWSHMVESAANFFGNMHDLEVWGGMWFAVVGLAFLGLFVRRVPFATPFVYGVPLYLTVIFLLGYLRVPYRLSPYDSANRMTLHIVALIFLYFGLKFIPILAGKRGAETTTAAGSG